MGALQSVLVNATGATFSRSTLIRIQEISAGNPFYAIELARALVARGAVLRPGEDLPVPSSLRDLVADRLNNQPRATRRLLLTAAMSSRPSIELLQERAGRDPCPCSARHRRSTGARRWTARDLRPSVVRINACLCLKRRRAAQDPCVAGRGGRRRHRSACPAHGPGPDWPECSGCRTARARCGARDRARRPDGRGRACRSVGRANPADRILSSLNGHYPRLRRGIESAISPPSANASQSCCR